MKIEPVDETLPVVALAKRLCLGHHAESHQLTLVTESTGGQLAGITFSREEYHTFRANLDAVAAGLWGPLQ